MKRNATPTNIIFGEGVVSIDGKPIGLTKDGAKFTVEYTYRAIEADGDKKKVKGRIVKDSAVAKLEINHLEVLTDLAKLHPGLNVDTTTKEGYTIIRGTNGIDDENDYHKVSFKGKTKDGRECEVAIDEAINLENLEWEFKDKNLPFISVEAAFEGVEDEEDDGTDEGWSITYKTEAGK